MNLESEHVILVDDNDVQTGTMDKMEAHRQGLLHRAFSVFIFNTKGELLLQQRAQEKYHSGGLWTNTCCSHPRISEQTLDAATRRLREEMELNCTLKPIFHFIYKAKLDKGLTEHELDHVFLGVSDELPTINHAEVQAYKYLSLPLLAADMKKAPEKYTVWLKEAYDQVASHIKSSL